YDGNGKRVEKITSFRTSLKGMTVTDEDVKDIATVQSFALTEEDLPKYKVDYKGQERIDELNTYVFEVKPVKLAANERYFRGKIWVDDKDFVIVKADGQAESEKTEQRFPHFQSYRENIDGKYWFPTYVYSDETLNFTRNSVHMKMTIRFTGYHKAI
ncbi:MAG TPA: outer membrane lipoprotein-sorting protein, partial [Blastocatellia bacterium]